MALLLKATAAVFALVLSCPVQAQVFRFEKTPVPPTYSLSTHYMFYVYAPEDAPKKEKEQATVVFQDLVATGQVPKGYSSVQVSLLPYNKFWNMINTERFCSTQSDVEVGKANKSSQLQLKLLEGAKSSEEMGVSITTVPFEKGMSATSTIKKTGMYILTFTNCGNFSNASVSGTIAVSNPHGYLPANEYSTLQFYGWLAVAYLLVLGVWAGAMVRFFKSLFYLQKGIGIIIVLCWLEAVVTWLQLHDFNSTGTRRDNFLVASLLFYTLKYVFAWRLILLAALGAGVVFEDLDTKTSIVFFVISLLFMLQQCVWKLVMNYRFSHLLETDFLILNVLPGALIYGGMFLWALLALSSMLTRLENQKQEYSVSTFANTRVVLIVGLVLSVLVLSLQVVDIAKGTLFSWRGQWLPVDGAPNVSFAMVLMAMMFVWWPSENSWRFAYTMQVDQDGEGEEMTGPPAAELENPVNGNGGVSEKKRVLESAVEPEQIGARSSTNQDDDDNAVLL